MNIANKDANLIVKHISNQLGWDIWFTYSDKRKDGTRRLKYMRNGWEPPAKMKDGILAKAKSTLSKYSNVQDIGWAIGDRPGYGSYDYFYVVVRDTDKNIDPKASTFVATEQGAIIDKLIKKGNLMTYISQPGSDQVRYMVSTSDRIKQMLANWKGNKEMVSVYKKAKPMATNKKAAFKEALGPKRTKELVQNGVVEVPKEVFMRLQ